MSISEAQARAAVVAAHQAADQIGVPMNVAVLDDGANLKAFARMDGALLGSIDIALRKAKTAALFGMNTEAIGEFCRGTSPGLELTNGGLVIFAGGIPIRDQQGRTIGAVGISGGAVEEDRHVAQVAVTAAEAQA